MLGLQEGLRRVQVVENGKAGAGMDGDADAQKRRDKQRRACNH